MKCQNRLFLKYHFSKKCFCFHYWDYLTNIWPNNWWSIFDRAEGLDLRCQLLKLVSNIESLFTFNYLSWAIYPKTQTLVTAYKQYVPIKILRYSTPISKFDGNGIIHADTFMYTNSNPVSRKVSYFLVSIVFVCRCIKQFLWWLDLNLVRLNCTLLSWNNACTNHILELFLDK